MNIWKPLLLLTIVLGLVFGYFSATTTRPQGERTESQNTHSLFSKPLTLLEPVDRTIQNEPETNRIDTDSSPDREILVAAPQPDESRDHLTLFGTVVDENNTPIENALISEELNFKSTRTDSNGRYELSVELPNNKYPVLNFLRTGYQEKRAGVTDKDLQTGITVRVDAKLTPADDTTTLNGWIGTDLGESLPGQEIRITSRGKLGIDNLYYGLLSDKNGEFSFEGIKSDSDYKLVVYSPPRFAKHVIEEIVVTQSTPDLRITLKQLSYVNATGMIISSAGFPIPNFKFDVKNTSTGSHFQSITSDSSGFFNLTHFPIGAITFTTDSPRNFFKVTGATISEQSYQDIVIALDKGHHHLSGWIRDENGIAIENARVTMVAKLLDGEIHSYSNRSKSTDNAGYFYFDNLGNVKHSLSVYATGYKRIEQTHSFEAPSEELSIILSKN